MREDLMSQRLIVAALLGVLSFAPGSLAKNGLGGDWELGAYMGLAIPDDVTGVTVPNAPEWSGPFLDLRA